jgi:integrase
MPFSKSAKKGRKSDLSGFRYDPKTKTAYFDLRAPKRCGGKRHRETVKDVTRDKALEAWGKARDLLKAPPPAAARTFRAFVADFWSKTTLGMNKRTLRGYQTHLDQIILPNLGDLALEKVDTATVRDLAAEMKAGVCKVGKGTAPTVGYAPTTIRRTVILVRRILRDAVERKDLAANPFDGRVRTDRPVRLKQELTPAELAAFVATFDDETGFREFWRRRYKRDEERRNEKPVGLRRPGSPWLPESDEVADHFRRFRAWKPVFIVALETGLRKGDLLALKWSSVDLADGIIRLTMAKTKEEAIVPISVACKAVLNEARFRRGEGELVFPGASTTMLFRYFQIAKDMAGIKHPFRFHDCRHTFASRLASQQVPLQIIAKALGHTTTQMSERYARPDEAAIRAAFASAERKEMDTLKDTQASADRADRGAV